MRLRTIDGLRGVAAMGVVLYHLDTAVAMTFDHWLHPMIRWWFQQGFRGVDIFFVLSGFVIPFSVRNADLSLGFLGRFALRRSIRLDPPYWAAILAEVALIWIGLRIGLADTPLPSTAQLLSHFFYLQNILGLGDIVDVFWTLCFEIQFYIGLVALLVAGRAIEARFGHRWMRRVAALVFGALFLVSIFGRYGVAGVSIHTGFALIRWFQFFMGVCVYWVVSGTTTWRPLVATWVVLFAILVGRDLPMLQGIPIATSALLWWSYRRDQMSTILAGSAVQFLGVISYSLYLIHATVGWRWVRLAGTVAGGDAPLPVVIAVFLSGCAVAVASAWMMWRWLERPAMNFSRVVVLPRRDAGPDLTGDRTAAASARPA